MRTFWKLSVCKKCVHVCTACKETKNKELIQWVSRCSSRIWQGSLAKDAWSKVSNGEGAWRPKKRQRAVGRPSKKKGPKLDSGKLLLCMLFLLFQKLCPNRFVTFLSQPVAQPAAGVKPYT